MNAKERLLDVIESGWGLETPKELANRIASEGLLAPEWVNAEDKPSPINACIRAAKRVIAALNLPEGAGVAMESDGSWWAFQNTAELRLIDDNEWWDGNGDELPETAIPQWPSDWRESWITLNTPEIE